MADTMWLVRDDVGNYLHRLGPDTYEWDHQPYDHGTEFLARKRAETHEGTVVRFVLDGVTSTNNTLRAVCECAGVTVPKNLTPKDVADAIGAAERERTPVKLTHRGEMASHILQDMANYMGVKMEGRATVHWGWQHLCDAARRHFTETERTHASVARTLRGFADSASPSMRQGLRDLAETVKLLGRNSAVPNDCPRCKRAFRFDEERENRLCAKCVVELGIAGTTAESPQMTCTYPEELDATDGACPAWWRGQERGGQGTVEAVAKRLSIALPEPTLAALCDALRDPNNTPDPARSHHYERGFEDARDCIARGAGIPCPKTDLIGAIKDHLSALAQRENLAGKVGAMRELLGLLQITTHHVVCAADPETTATAIRGLLDKERADTLDELCRKMNLDAEGGDFEDIVEAIEGKGMTFTDGIQEGYETIAKLFRIECSSFESEYVLERRIREAVTADMVREVCDKRDLGLLLKGVTVPDLVEAIGEHWRHCSIGAVKNLLIALGCPECDDQSPGHTYNDIARKVEAHFEEKFGVLRSLTDGQIEAAIDRGTKERFGVSGAHGELPECPHEDCCQSEPCKRGEGKPPCGHWGCEPDHCEDEDSQGGVVVVEAPETPIDPEPICLPTCGTAHRGCDPQCPKRWYEKGQEENDPPFEPAVEVTVETRDPDGKLEVWNGRCVPSIFGKALERARKTGKDELPLFIGDYALATPIENLEPAAWEVLIGAERMPVGRPFESLAEARTFARLLREMAEAPISTAIRTLFAKRDDYPQPETTCEHCHEAMAADEKRACPEQDDPGGPCVPEVSD